MAEVASSADSSRLAMLALHEVAVAAASSRSTGLMSPSLECRQPRVVAAFDEVEDRQPGGVPALEYLTVDELLLDRRHEAPHMGCERATQALTHGLQGVEQRPQFVAKVRILPGAPTSSV
jgi:hypothetical protein